MKRDLQVDFVGRHRTWFIASGIVFLIALGSLVLRGLNLSIDFTGGSSFTVSGITEPVEASDVESTAEDAGATRVSAQMVREGGQVTGAIVRTEQIPPGTPQEGEVIDALVQATGASDVQPNFIGPTFGERISSKMVQALIVFLAIVILYISFRLEFKMSMAAIVALIHDLALTAGAYSLLQFNVSPATVIAFLTILGYSLYDTVIVFDRIQENTGRMGGAGKRTYSQAVNTSMNEVLWRSLNTTITSGLPVGALLFIGSQALGAATLQDLALALFVGMISGAYSSLFIAGPVLSLWKEREPKYARMAEHASRRPEGDEEGEAAEGEAPQRDEPRLEPRGYVRGPGKTPRSRRG